MRLSVGSWKVIATLVLAFTVFAATDLGAQERGDVKQLLEEGVHLYNQGKLDEAKEKLEKALLVDPTSEAALEAVEVVGFDILIKMVGEKHKLAVAARRIMEITALEYRKRSSDPDAVQAVIAEYFENDNIVEYTRAIHRGISEHGVYLLPGLIEHLGSAEADIRTKAILGIKKLSDDAVVPLCRALGHSDPIVVQGVCASLGHIKNPGAIPSLLRVADSSDDQVVREVATKTIRALGGDPSVRAYDALIDQARLFYLDPSYLSRTYHHPIIWKITDGKLTYDPVHSWAVNELTAEQWIDDARAIDPSGARGNIMKVCNRFQQVAEFNSVLTRLEDRARQGAADESDLEELRSERSVMARRSAEAAAFGAEIQIGSLARSLEDRRPGVAEIILASIQDSLTEGDRAQTVSPILSQALSYQGHRGVRFAAAECLAYMNPSASFGGLEQVIPQLSHGMVVAGTRIALTILPDQDDALRIGGALAASNVQPFNEPNPWAGLNRARGFPPEDLIVISTDPGDELTTGELIAKLRSDRRTNDIPILVIADDSELTKAKGLYEDESRKVWVIRRTIEKTRLREDVLVDLWADDSSARARSVAISSRAARAMHYLAARETVYDIRQAEAALVNVLGSRDVSVQIPACRALGCLKTRSAVPAMLEICKEGDSSPVELREACYRAIGDILAGSGNIDPQVEQILKLGEANDDIRLFREVKRVRAKIGGNIQPAVMTSQRN